MPEPSPFSSRRARLLRFGAAVCVLVALAGYVAVQYITGRGEPRCRVVSGKGDGASYEFTPEQAVNAATVSAVGTTRGLPERAVAVALATALQESGLRNIKHGDRDSVGLFQQRPSQGWGTKKQIMDPAYAAGEFYAHLVKISGYAKLPLTVVAQRVQHSGYPEAYAKHEPDAVLLAAALTGRAAATLTCGGRQAPTPPGGTDAVRAALVRDFGRDVLQPAGAEVSAEASTPSPASTRSTTRTSPASPAAKATAEAVTVPVPRRTADRGSVRQRGWELAHWAVAHSATLHISRVSFAGREWSRGGFANEWRTAGESGADKSTAEVRIVTGR